MKKTAILLLLLVAFAGQWANADFGSYLAHQSLGQSVQIDTSQGTLELTAISDGAIYVHYIEPDVKQLPSFALADSLPLPTTALSSNAMAIDFSTQGLTARVFKDPVRIEFLVDGEVLLAEEHGYFAMETLRGFRFGLDPDEKILGGGQRVLGMDRRGQRMPLYNRAHYGYTTQSEQMYFGLSAVMSSDKYVIAFDNSAAGHLDIGKTEPDVLQFEAVAGRTAYLVAVGATYPSLIENFTAATGRQPLPPRWAFGNFASRFGYRSEQEARDVVKKFRDAEIPLDAVVLDLFWFGPDIKGHLGNLDWDRNTFPTPESMIADFREDGVRTITITEPFVLHQSKQWSSAVDNKALALSVTGEPRRFDFYFGNTGLVDVFNADSREWFNQFYDRLMQQGVAGHWGDLGEPEVHPSDTQHHLSDADIRASADEIHNAYGHRWAQMVYENQLKFAPDSRPMIMMRAGFLGSQRYGMIPWTGDVDRSWDGLKPQVELSLQMGLLGLAYTHSDLGGFAGGEEFDKEMYIRWLQYGVFQPVYRPHAQDHIAPEPVFHDRETQRIVRRAIELRYRLLPYLYTLAYENSTTGMPLMRPVFFEDESNPALIDIKDTYLWGDAFLVKPITNPGKSPLEVTLPDGVWFEFDTGRRHLGGQTISVPTELETLPVLVRGGAFIPMTEIVQRTDDYSSASLELHYYADSAVASAEGQMFEDDGLSGSSLRDGNFELLQFAASHSDDALAITLQRVHEYPQQRAARSIDLVVHNWSVAPERVSVNDRNIEQRRRLRDTRDGFSYNADSRQLRVRFDWDHTAHTIHIQ